MYSVPVLSECQFVGWYYSFNRYISSFSVFSLWRISRQGQWFPGLDMSLRFANRALQQVPAAISQVAEHPCSPVYDDGTKFVSPWWNCPDGEREQEPEEGQDGHMSLHCAWGTFLLPITQVNGEKWVSFLLWFLVVIIIYKICCV